MVSPIAWSHVEHALTTPIGWIEAAIVAGSLLVAFLVDRNVRMSTADRAGVARVGAGGVNRLLFPITALALLTIGALAFRRFHPPFLLAIALPLVLALVGIRIVVYALRGLVGQARWLAGSERAIAYTVWGLVILYFLGVLPEIGAELDAIELPVGKAHVSVLAIAKGAFGIVLTISIALWVSGLLEQRLMKAEGLDLSLRVVAVKTLRALLLVAAVLFALQAVGLDLTLLSVFGGALGVGVGLGLQKLASNYIAGFTILLDRSIRMGDMITVDNRFGTVSKVTSRYVVVRGLDGVEAIVPNETLVTTTVLNHSYSNREVRIGLPVQVAYGTDIELALRLMTDAARAQPRVLKEPSPAPLALFKDFADSGINLEVGFWINDPENGQGNLKSDVGLAVLKAFDAHGISIPFPQREIRILGNPAPASPAA